jgi:hypothetical protein
MFDVADVACNRELLAVAKALLVIFDVADVACNSELFAVAKAFDVILLVALVCWNKDVFEVNANGVRSGPTTLTCCAAVLIVMFCEPANSIVPEV